MSSFFGEGKFPKICQNLPKFPFFPIKTWIYFLENFDYPTIIPIPPPPFCLNLLLHKSRGKRNISQLFACFYSFFSTPTDISFHLTLAGRVLERSLGVGAATKLTLSLVPSLLCSSISAVCLNLLRELESNRHRICTKKRSSSSSSCVFVEALSTQGRISSSRWGVLWFLSRFSQCGVESSPHSTGIRLQRKSQCGGIYKATALSLSLSLSRLVAVELKNACGFGFLLIESP